MMEMVLRRMQLVLNRVHHLGYRGRSQLRMTSWRVDNQKGEILAGMYCIFRLSFGRDTETRSYLLPSQK